MSSSRLFPILLFLLCVSLSTIHPLTVSSLSFNIFFSQCGFDPPGEVLFHQISPKNLSSPYHPMRDLVLPDKDNQPKHCDDCSRVDWVIYRRPLLLWDKVTQEIASFSMTLCLRINHEEKLFLFLTPYPWDENGRRIEVELDRNSMGRDRSSSIGSDVVCAHFSYHSTTQMLKTYIRISDRSCQRITKVDRGSMPNEVVVGFASTTAAEPIKLQNILTWAFHSTFQFKDPVSTLPQDPTAADDDSSSSIDWGEQWLRFDPWNRNAELSLRFQRNYWQRNWQLTCSLNVSPGLWKRK